MPNAHRDLVVYAPIETFWDTIVDFDRYTDFQPELQSVEVLERSHERYLVAFTVLLIKRIHYVLEFRPEPPHTLSWDLAESNLLTMNRGRWKLREDGGRTRATYDLEVEIGRFVPRAILTKLVDVSLPKMLDRFKEQAEIAAR